MRRGDPITGLDRLPAGTLLFHAGTRRDPDGTVRTSGGRVLTVVGRGDSLDAARAAAYAGLRGIRFEGMWHRRDIADPAGAQVAAGAGALRT